MRRHLMWIVPLFAVAASGCHNGMWSPFSPPGTKEFQQRQAVIHDPYPQNDIATPLPDGRPRDYLYPPAETVRTRTVPDALMQAPLTPVPYQ